MYWLKSCPRCHGDLYGRSDIHGSYIGCFQCGHYLTVAEDIDLRAESPRGMTCALPSTEPSRALTEVAA